MKRPADRPLRRHLAAVMFTDMAGYTALMQRDEAAALRSRERHRNALESAVPTHGGELLQYFGDGSLSVFHSSVRAVRAAIAIQRELGGEPPLRIGLHLGDIAYDEQGAYGNPVNIAARLEALSVPGGILVSEKIHDDIRSQPGITAVAAGTVRLKNVAEPVRTFAIAAEGVAVPSDPVGGTAAGSGLPTLLLRRLEERARRPALANAPTGTVPGRVPLVGRDRETKRLRELLDRTEAGMGGTAIFRGSRGVGKTRLAQEAADYARTRGWTVLSGRAWSAEHLVPFAPFSDALVPLLQGLDPESLESLAPGGIDALRTLFPVLGVPARLPEQHGERGELQAQLFWHFVAMLGRLAEHRPVLLVFEDLDFADRSSLDLLHFTTRQCPGRPVFVIGQYSGLNAAQRHTLLAIEQSLLSMQACTVFELQPLGREETGEFVRRALGVVDQDTTRLAGLLHHWTGGNPFFLTGSLRGLVEMGALRREGGAWLGLDLETLELPRSVRDAVLVWMGYLSDTGRAIAELLAVLGKRATYEVLLHLADRPESDVANALDELQHHQILVESEERWHLLYDFRHPLIRETLRADLPLSRRRALHAAIAEALESLYGRNAEAHADELAYHFSHARPGQAGVKAVRYLVAAGTVALRRNANREAAACLQEALDRVEATPPGADLAAIEGVTPVDGIMSGLARARRRLGEVRTSVALWRRALAAAQAEGDAGRIAAVQREIGLAFMAGGELEEAIDAFERALDTARDTHDLALMVRVQLARALCYHAAGRGDTAVAVAEEALDIARRLERPGPLGRVHGALLRLHIWTGRLDEVRAHAERALALARETGDRGVEFWSQWSMGAMEGLIGNTAEMARRIESARRLADGIGSPFLQLETVELSIELAYAHGDWDLALEVGEPAIALARSLGQRSILPRLLVWVSRIHLGRSDFERADAYTREAWDVCGADRALAENDFRDVHAIVPAHIGRAAYHLTRNEWSEAIRIAEAGLAIADRTRYVVWAIHHILPVIAEAAIHSRDLARAHEIGHRMRREAEAVGHPLGLAWADACDAILTWLEGDPAAGAVSLRRGAEALETIPLVYEGARMRRQLAARLVETGDRDGALEQLLRIHETFATLGARHELDKTVEQLAELGVAPPARAGAGAS